MERFRLIAIELTNKAARIRREKTEQRLADYERNRHFRLELFDLACHQASWGKIVEDGDDARALAQLLARDESCLDTQEVTEEFTPRRVYAPSVGVYGKPRANLKIISLGRQEPSFANGANILVEITNAEGFPILWLRRNYYQKDIAATAVWKVKTESGYTYTNAGEFPSEKLEVLFGLLRKLEMIRPVNDPETLLLNQIYPRSKLV